MVPTNTGNGFMHTMTTNYMHGYYNGRNMFAFAHYARGYTNRGFYNTYNRQWHRYSKSSYINDFRYNGEIYNLNTYQYDMITPQGSSYGGSSNQGTIQPGYELDAYQMKLGFYGQKNSDGSTNSQNFDLKFKGSEINWPVIYYMDKDHVHRL